MSEYLGILIAQSLATPDVLKQFSIEARKPAGSWEILLVSVPVEELERHMRTLQGAMRKNEPWYAHHALLRP